MKRSLNAALFCLTVSFFSIFAQAPKPTAPEDKDPVVITTNLIQIDVIATDENGNIIAYLNADDSPNLAMQLKIFRAGKETFASQERALKLLIKLICSVF